MGTLERPYPSSLSPYSLTDTHITTQQSPTTFYDSINEQRLYPSEHISSHIPFSYPPRMRTSADTGTPKQNSGMGMMNAGLTEDNMSASTGTMKRTNKTHVPSACVNCKRAHLACDVSRPCKRCVALGKVDTCIDIKHKKRGRPKLKDKKSHPYNTHATADAKTWVQNPQFLPPTTTNPSPPNLHQQTDQPPQPPNSFSSTYNNSHHHSSSRNHLHHHHNHHHHRRHHQSTSYITKSPKFINQQPTSISSSRQNPQQENTPTITMFLTIDNMTCARVSDECLGIMGYYHEELVHKSLYDYIHVHDTDKFQKLINSLFDNASRFCQNQFQSIPSSDPVTSEDPRFSQTNPEFMQYPACGGQLFDVSDVIHLKERIGRYSSYEVRMYLGGGLGADLARKDTWNKLYIVAFFTRINAQSRNPIVTGFSTQITSPTTTIDPALLTMHNTTNNGSPNLGIGRSGLLSPPVPSLQLSDNLYNEANHSPPTFSNNLCHRKPLRPFNSHESLSSIVPRPNPITHISSRPEPLISSIPSPTSTCSFDRRSSAFSTVRSPSDNNLSFPFYNEVENNQSNRFHNNNDNTIFDHPHRHDHGEIPSSSSNDSFPTFRNDERAVEDMMIPTISRKSSSRVGAVGDDSRMSVNSLLC